MRWGSIRGAEGRQEGRDHHGSWQTKAERSLKKIQWVAMCVCVCVSVCARGVCVCVCVCVCVGGLSFDELAVCRQGLEFVISSQWPLTDG